jgi:hypothetical protein
MVKMSEAEFERQFAEASKCGTERMAEEPRAVEAFYDRDSARVVVHLCNGCTFIFPPELADVLSNASATELEKVTIIPPGYGLDWPDLNASFDLFGLVAGIFGTKRWLTELGRKGDRVTSDAKARAVRENGTKGGRPRKSP